MVRSRRRRASVRAYLVSEDGQSVLEFRKEYGVRGRFAQAYDDVLEECSAVVAHLGLELDWIDAIYHLGAETAIRIHVAELSLETVERQGRLAVITESTGGVFLSCRSGVRTERGSCQYAPLGDVTSVGAAETVGDSRVSLGADAFDSDALLWMLDVLRIVFYLYDERCRVAYVFVEAVDDAL